MLKCLARQMRDTVENVVYMLLYSVQPLLCEDLSIHEF